MKDFVLFWLQSESKEIIDGQRRYQIERAGARPLHFTSCNSDAQCVTHYSSIQCREICVGKQKEKLTKLLV